MAPLQVRVDHGVFFLAGDLDMTHQEIFDAWIPRMCEGAGPVVLDVTDLAFMDSTGIRGLLRICAERPVVLRNAQPNVKRVIEIVGLDARPEIRLED